MRAEPLISIADPNVPRRRRDRGRDVRFRHWQTKTSCNSCAAATRAAFEVVYDRHATAAFSLAYRMTGTRNVAEDVVQEAFL